MEVNNTNLRNATIPIDYTMNYLENVIICYKGIEVPEDFKYFKELTVLPNDINELIKKIKLTKNTLKKQVDNYETAENKNNSIVSQLVDGVAMTTIEGKDYRKDKFISKYLGAFATVGGYVNGLFNFRRKDGRPVAVGTIEYRSCLKNNTQLVMEKSKKYTRLEEVLINTYRFKDENEVCKLISIMGTNSEIPTYAAAVEKIVSTFNNEREEFEEIFGFPLYEKINPVVSVLNVEKIYLDLFINTNKDILIMQDANGKNIVNPNAVDVDQNMIAKIKSANINTGGSNIKDLINNYLKAKKINIEI